MSRLFLSLLLCLVTSSVSAEDYSASEEDWNGIGYLETTGAEARVQVNRLETLDLGKLRPDDVLLWVYPSQPMPVEDLLVFVREGGHLIVADDVGTGDRFLSAIGLARKPLSGDVGATDGAKVYRERANIPILGVEEEHFLFFNVDEVVANHGVVLSGAGEVILAAGGARQGLIQEVRLGEGAVLAIGDPSMFINAMLRRFYGNKQLAANMMRYYCLSDPCEVSLVTPGTRIAGRYRSGLGRFGALPRVLDESVGLLNRALGAVDRQLGTSPGPFVLVLLAVFITVALLAQLLLGGRRLVEATRPVLTAQVSPQRHESVALIQEQDEADFLEPVETLLRELPEVKLRQLLLRGPRTTGPEDGRRWKAAKAAVLRIQQEADSVRQADSAPVSAERFMSLLQDIRAVGAYMEEGAAAPPAWPEGDPSAVTRPSS
ncbi:MAG: DUF4350 domain-containing protein [Myxococcota bacterium]